MCVWQGAWWFVLLMVDFRAPGNLGGSSSHSKSNGSDNFD